MDKIIAIARTTYCEALRSKVLYSSLFFAVVVVLVSALFGTVTIGDEVRVIKDFGLFSISLFSVGFAVLAGASFLHKELSRRTVFNILAKPVGRWQFITGKFLGMLATSILLIMLMGAGLSTFVALFEGRVDPLMFQGYLFIVLDLIVVCGLTIFFSAIVVTPMLSGLFAFCTFVAGRSADYLLTFAATEGLSVPLSFLSKALYYVVPHLHRLNISNDLVYGITVSPQYFLAAFVYALGYTTILLVIGSFIFSKREFN